MHVPVNWHFLQSDGIVYLCYHNNNQIPIRYYAIKGHDTRPFVLHLYDHSMEEYRLDSEHQHPNYRQRDYGFWTDFCIWNITNVRVHNSLQAI